jgi:ABC-2 type transport system permease protein
MFSAVGFGLFIGSFGLITSNMNLIMNILAMILLAFSGANFPVEWLPSIVQKLSYCLPITRSIKAANFLMRGQAASSIYSLIGYEFLLGILYILLGYFLMKLTEYLSKKRATLDLY